MERLEHVRLDRCGLVSLLGSAGSGPGSSTPPALTAATISSAPLRSLRNVVSLYLQKNRLVDLGGAINAETTPRLRFLALSDNALTFDDTALVSFEGGDTKKTRTDQEHPLRGLETLPALMYLDCSGNVRLCGVAPLLERLPSSVAFCDFSRCALSFVDEYRPALVASFDALKQLDGVAVTRQERRDARALLGEEGDGDADRDGSGFERSRPKPKKPKKPHHAERRRRFSCASGPRRARPSSNPSVAAAAAAAFAMSDEDDHGSDASIEPVTEAEPRRIAAPSGRRARGAAPTRTPRTPSATVTFFSLATPGESNRRGSWNGTGPRTARQRVWRRPGTRWWTSRRACGAPRNKRAKLSRAKKKAPPVLKRFDSFYEST